MKKRIYVLSGLVILVGGFYGLRNLWYYPLYRRPPVLEIISSKPAHMVDFTLGDSGNSLKRYYQVFNDKNKAFPESSEFSWSLWARSHEMTFDTSPKWVKIFLEEKWLVFKKRFSFLFFNSGDKNILFDHFMARRHNLSPGISPKRYRVFFLGDSLTEGLFSSKKENGFVSMVENEIGQTRNLNAVGIKEIKTIGMKMEDIAVYLNSGLDFVVVELGTNDYPTTPVDEFQNNYSRLLRFIRTKASNAKLLCLGIWQGYLGWEYDEAIMKLAEKNNAEFVYIGDIFENQKNKSRRGDSTPWGPADDFHPSDAGHLAIANRIVSAITNESALQTSVGE